MLVARYFDSWDLGGGAVGFVVTVLQDGGAVGFVVTVLRDVGVVFLLSSDDVCGFNCVEAVDFPIPV